MDKDFFDVVFFGIRRHAPLFCRCSNILFRRLRKVSFFSSVGKIRSQTKEGIQDMIYWKVIKPNNYYNQKNNIYCFITDVTKVLGLLQNIAHALFVVFLYFYQYIQCNWILFSLFTLYRKISIWIHTMQHEKINIKSFFINLDPKFFSLRR